MRRAPGNDMSHTENEAQRWPRRPLLAAGLLLACAAAAGFYPVATGARLLSPDGAIESGTAALMHGSQHALAALLLLAALLPGALARRWCDALAAMERHPARWPYGAAAAALAWTVQEFLFDGMPHITDATSHWFQARILAAGHLAAPLPACYEFFAQHNVIMSPEGLWHTKYFPGQAAFLALGALARLPSLVMPAGWGLATIAATALTERAFDRATARWAALLLALSPIGALLAGSFMSHSTFVLFSALALWFAATAIDRAREGRRAFAWWMGAGACAGWAALTRPQDLVTPLALVAGYLVFAKDAWRAALRAIPGAALGAALPAACLVGWNVALYGSPLASGYHFGSSGSLTPVIQDAFGLTAAHTPAKAAVQTAWSLLRLNSALFGWPGGLLLAAMTLLRRWDRRDATLLAAAAAPVALYFFFPYYSAELEARYYAPAVPLLAILAARGLRRIDAGPRRWAAVAALVLTAHAAIHYWPSYLVPRYARDYEEAGPGLHRAAEAAGLRDALVLVPDARYDQFRYSSGFVFNDPWLRGDVIYARDLGRDYDCLREAHPARRLYRFIPESDWSGGRFEPVDG